MSATRETLQHKSNTLQLVSESIQKYTTIMNTITEDDIASRSLRSDIEFTTNTLSVIKKEYNDSIVEYSNHLLPILQVSDNLNDTLHRIQNEIDSVTKYNNDLDTKILESQQIKISYSSLRNKQDEQTSAFMDFKLKEHIENAKLLK